MSASTVLTDHVLATRAITTWDSQGVATGGIVDATPSILVEVLAINSSGSTRYLQFFDSATVPADATVPTILPIAIPAGGMASLVLPEGLSFATGLSWASSTTLATKTITLAADLWVTVRHY